MKNKKGFTLIELLAVIVILAVIALIALPSILNIVKESKIKALVSDAQIVTSTILDKEQIYGDFDITLLTVDNMFEKLGIKNSNYSSIEVTEINDEPYFVGIGKNTFEGYSVCGTLTTMHVEEGDGCSATTDLSCFEYEELPSELLSYDIDEEACVDFFLSIDFPEGSMGNMCTGGENSFGKTIDDYLNGGMSDTLIEQLLESETIINRVYSDIGLTITGYTCGGYYNQSIDYWNEENLIEGTDMNPIIPSIINGKKVIEIAPFSFSPKDEDWNEDFSNPIFIDSVIISEGIEIVGMSSFSTNNLKSVVFSESIKNIDVLSFYGNKLTSIEIPPLITEIKSKSFSMNRLTSLVIPENINIISDSAFYSNQLSGTLLIPASVTDIKSYAFSDNYIEHVVYGDCDTSKITVLNSSFMGNGIDGETDNITLVVPEYCS